MENKNQTAVGWYYEQTVVQGKTNYAELLDQALAMEKEQIVEAFLDSQESTWRYSGSHQEQAEQYYNETYNTDKP